MTEYKEGKALTEQAMLVRLNITGWSGKITDLEVMEDVARRAGAQGPAREVGTYSKRLILKEALKGIQQTANSMRVWHTYYTMPWDDGSARLLPVSLHEAYTAKMDELIERRITETNKLVNNWDVYLEEARRRLGNLYKPQNYPTRAELVNRISQEYYFTPVPDASHFAVKAMEHETQERIKREFERQIQAKIESTVSDIYSRLRETTGAIVDRLSEPTKDGKPKVFRDTLISNLTYLLDVLPALNLTNNAELNAIGDELTAALEGVKPEHLRTGSKAYSAEKRQQVKDAAEAVNVKLAGYFGDVPAAV